MNILPLSISAIFCDSVRSEMGGFKTIVGVYARKFNVKSFPYQFPKLSVYVRGTYANNNPILSLTIRILNGANVIIDHPAPKDFLNRTSSVNDNSSRTFGTTIVMIGEEIAEPCTITVVAIVNGDEYLVGDLRVALSEKPDSHDADAAHTLA